MLICQLLFHSAHPHHSDRCEAIQQHSIFIEIRQGQRTRQEYNEVMLRHVAVATYDTEIFVPGSQTLQTARIITVLQRKAAQCSVATNNDNL
jgi:hypothetical protein